MFAWTTYVNRQILPTKAKTQDRLTAPTNQFSRAIIYHISAFWLNKQNIRINRAFPAVQPHLFNFHEFLLLCKIKPPHSVYFNRIPRRWVFDFVIVTFDFIEGGKTGDLPAPISSISSVCPLSAAHVWNCSTPAATVTTAPPPHPHTWAHY